MLFIVLKGDLIFNKVVASFPASGLRSSTSGALGNLGTNGYAWSVVLSGANGYYLLYGSTSVSPFNAAARAYARSVRCVQYLHKYYLCFVKTDFLIGITLSTVSVSVS